MNTQSPLLWGIDLGGTKVEGIILDASTGKAISRLRVPTEAHEGYSHILDQIENVVIALEKESGLTRSQQIGIGTPGVCDPSTGTMLNANTTCLIGKPLIQDLENKLGVTICADNDANCFVLAEATHGAGKGYEHVFGVILGTGVGGGLVIHGKLWPGLHHIAGEWGHNILEPDGLPCYCGKKGCVETVLSGPSLERYYERLAGSRLSLREIVAQRGTDPSAAKTVDHLIRYFGLGLSVIVNILDPQAIIIGGGVGQIAALYDEGVESLYQQTFHPRPHTRVLRPDLGDSAGVIGAAMLTV